MNRNILALDIGGTKIAGALLGIFEDKQPQILFTESIPTQAIIGGPQVASRVVEFAQKIKSHAAAMEYPVGAVAISTAGVVDTKTGEILSATNLMPGWAGIALGNIVSDSLGLPVTVLNDVHAHALGEITWGAGAGAQDALVVTVGTGIGGAVIYNGKLVFGAHHAAGHLGHTAYQEGPRLSCSCGSEGHVEAIASGSGLAKLYNHLLSTNTSEANRTPLNSGLAVSQRVHEDELASQALKISARALGQALGNLANSFDPQMIIISGSMVENGKIWWDALKEGYEFSALPILAQTPLLKGNLGGSAALLGATAFNLNTETMQK